MKQRDRIATGSSSDEDSLQKYVSGLLSESLVTGVPSIVKASNWPKRIFKSCTLLLCMAGFLYQTTVFVSYFLSYPSSVDILVEALEDMMAPAITICNNNGIERTKFCNAFPDRCIVLENKTEFCLIYPENCDIDTEEELFMVPREDYYEFEGNATLQDFKNLSLEKELFYRLIRHEMSTGYTFFLYRIRKPIPVLGPFVLYKQKALGTVCYTLNSCVKNCTEPIKMDVAGSLGRIRDPKLTFELHFDKSESFLPGRDAGGWLSLHSPFEISNPYYQGYFIKPDRRYSVIFEAEKVELLPHPYRANCRNYTDDWLKSGRTGPTSETVCIELCDLKVTQIACNNCSDKWIDYPQDEDDACQIDYKYCHGKYSMDTLRECIKDCKDDCLRHKFPYTVEERPLHENMLLKRNSPGNEKKTRIEVYLGEADTITYRHRPHYQDIEVFGYVGGYIGAWLGISLVAVTDFVESMCSIAVFAFKKWNLKKNRRKDQFL